MATEKTRKKSGEEYTVGIDLGTSSIKASLLRLRDNEVVASYTSPSSGKELEIISPKPGWAEQDPNMWWDNACLAIKGVLKKARLKGEQVSGIGVAYQMHGMTPVDEDGKARGNAIIWCDGRTSEIKERIENNSGLAKRLLEDTLNLPGHFTASKARWFMDENGGLIPGEEFHMLLPGHYILKRATGQSTVTPSGLSEGILWSFKNMSLSELVMRTLRLDERLIPEITPTFGEHGKLTRDVAKELGLKEGTPFTYFAGDQPNNALAVNVLEPGEIAAAAGTSAVMYGVTDKPKYDPRTRVNSFLHVNSSTDTREKLRIGILGCLNGAGISYRFARDELGGGSYGQMDELAASVPSTDGLVYIPFGSGPERTQEDRNTGAHFIGLDLRRHTKAHIYRAILEGIAYSMANMVKIMREMGMPVECTKATDTGLFKNRLFGQILARETGAPIELYKTDGSEGAARGAAIGLGRYTLENVFNTLEMTERIEPDCYRWQQQVEHMSRA